MNMTQNQFYQIKKVDGIKITKKQEKEIEDFKKNLQDGKVGFDFEGSFLEGKSYLEGLSQIVDTVNN